MLKRFFLSERNVMTIILLNAIVIFILYFPDFKNNFFLISLDHFFVVVFLVEALVKIRYLKPRVYFTNGWNQFDFVIVIASLPSLFISLMPLPDASVLLILRLLRFVRMIRFIQFVPHLGKIMVGLGRALRASVFVLLALFFFNFLLAIFTCHFYGDSAPQYFGNPLLAAYSIFQMFTVEGWHEIPTAIAKSSNNTLFIGITRVYFVLIVLFGGIFGMSLANAVFVDEMTMDNTDAIEAKIDNLQAQVQELKDLLDKAVQKDL